MNNKDLLYKKLNALRLEVHSSIVDDIVTTVDDLFSQPNGSKPDVSGSLPPSLIYIDRLIPVAKTELQTIVDLVGHDAIVLTRLVSKVEEYLAAMTV